jgi:hypothetical protein
VDLADVDVCLRDRGAGVLASLPEISANMKRANGEENTGNPLTRLGSVCRLSVP